MGQPNGAPSGICDSDKLSTGRVGAELKVLNPVATCHGVCLLNFTWN
jgi:hypothetical protein